MAVANLRAESARYNPTLRSPNLRTAVGAALRAFDVTPTRFGLDAVGDPRFVFDLRAGRRPRGATETRVRAYISKLGGGDAL